MRVDGSFKWGNSSEGKDNISEPKLAALRVVDPIEWNNFEKASFKWCGDCARQHRKRKTKIENRKKN